MDQMVVMPVDDDGEHILVFEVGDLSDDGLELAADGSGAARRAATSLEKALNDLKPAVRKLKETLDAVRPKEAEVEFGLTVGGETGLIIAKGSTEVNFRIRVSWSWE